MIVVNEPKRSTAIVLEFAIASGEIVRVPVSFNVNSRQRVVEAKIETPKGLGPRKRYSSQFSNAGNSGIWGRPGSPSVGSTLIAFVDSQAGAAEDTSFSFGAWTQIAAKTSSGGVTSIWVTEVEEGDEDSFASIAVTVDGATYLSGVLDEYENLASPVVLAGTSATTTQANVESLAIGPTGTASQDNVLALAIWGSGSSRAGTIEDPPTNGFEFTSIIDSDNRLMVASKLPQDDAAQSTVCSWTRLVTSRGLLLLLEAATPDAADDSLGQEFRRFVEFELEALPAPPLPDPPNAPTGFEAELGGTVVTLSWNGSAGATGYVVYENGNEIWSHDVALNVSGTVETTTIRGTIRDLATAGPEGESATPGDYVYTVAARNRGGLGDLSAPQTISFGTEEEEPEEDPPPVDEVTTVLEFQAALNALAGTDGLAPQAAANALAGTNALALLGALNVAAGSYGLGLDGVCNRIAGTEGLSATFALNVALVGGARVNLVTESVEEFV